jgi:hypothetical protein
MVLFVAIIVQLIALKRLATARRVCGFATVLSCLVVIYSLSLLLSNAKFT